MKPPPPDRHSATSKGGGRGRADRNATRELFNSGSVLVIGLIGRTAYGKVHLIMHFHAATRGWCDLGLTSRPGR